MLFGVNSESKSGIRYGVYQIGVVDEFLQAFKKTSMIYCHTFAWSGTDIQVNLRSEVDSSSDIYKIII